jgi:CrcB protein
MIKNLIYIVIGGGFGSALRYLIQYAVHKNYPNAFPYGTFLVNIIGCFLVGLLISAVAKEKHMAQHLELLLIVGFCGGFTTFSTFAYEGNSLLGEGRIGYAFLYIGLSVLAGMLFAYLGFRLGKG